MLSAIWGLEFLHLEIDTIVPNDWSSKNFKSHKSDTRTNLEATPRRRAAALAESSRAELLAGFYVCLDLVSQLTFQMKTRHRLSLSEILFQSARALQ